jgi:hypothetical protein
LVADADDDADADADAVAADAPMPKVGGRAQEEAAAAGARVESWMRRAASEEEVGARPAADAELAPRPLISFWFVRFRPDGGAFRRWMSRLVRGAGCTSV